MFQKIATAALAIGALTLGAPAATADDATADCGFDSLQVGAVAETYEGVAYGYVAHAGDTDATIRCYVEVNGADVSSTPTGTGVTAGPISFSAGDEDVVRMCAVTDAHGQTVRCALSTRQQIPPDEVWDTLDEIFIGPGPSLCDFFMSVEGQYGDIVIGSDGDIYVAGEPFYDCPPYQHFPPT